MAGQDLQGLTRPRPARPRVADWPEQLAALIEGRRDRPFEWGTHDCCMFAADAVQVLTGDDPLTAYRGTYSTEEEAAAKLGEAGLEAAALERMATFGAPLIRPSLAQRGDVALVAVRNHLLLGVVTGERIVVPDADRLAEVPLRLAIRAWAI